MFVQCNECIDSTTAIIKPISLYSYWKGFSAFFFKYSIDFVSRRKVSFNLFPERSLPSPNWNEVGNDSIRKGCVAHTELCTTCIREQNICRRKTKINLRIKLSFYDVAREVAECTRVPSRNILGSFMWSLFLESASRESRISRDKWSEERELGIFTSDANSRMVYRKLCFIVFEISALSFVGIWVYVYNGVF